MTERDEEIHPIARRLPNSADQMVYEHTERLRLFFGRYAYEGNAIERIFTE